MLLYSLLENTLIKAIGSLISSWKPSAKKNADAENNNAGAEHILAQKKSSNGNPSDEIFYRIPSQPIDIPLSTRIKPRKKS